METQNESKKRLQKFILLSS